MYPAVRDATSGHDHPRPKNQQPAELGDQFQHHPSWRTTQSPGDPLSFKVDVWNIKKGNCCYSKNITLLEKDHINMAPSPKSYLQAPSWTSFDPIVSKVSWQVDLQTSNVPQTWPWTMTVPWLGRSHHPFNGKLIPKSCENLDEDVCHKVEGIEKHVRSPKKVQCTGLLPVHRSFM